MSSARIFVVCPGVDTPCGGVKKLHRLAEILAGAGFDATLLYPDTVPRFKWFQHAAPVRTARAVRIRPDDWLVLPEAFEKYYSARASWSWSRQKRTRIRLARCPARVVVFNQNCYFTFRGHSWTDLSRPTLYERPETVAALVVSEDSRQYLRLAFPQLRLFRIRYSVDPDLFAPSTDKKPQLAYMPRKNAQDAVQVLKILRARGSLDGFRVVAIDGMSEREVARTLRESAFFLSFGFPEGFGLPPAEAMACGCYVVGYDGLGGREFLRPEFSSPVETGNIRQYVQAVETALDQWRRWPDTIRRRAQAAAEFVRRAYSPENEQADVLSAWRCLLAETSRGSNPPASSKAGPGRQRELEKPAA